MTDWDRLIAKTKNKYYVEYVTTKKVFYNIFGDKISETTKTESSIYTFNEDYNAPRWVKGTEETENETDN